MSDAIHRTTLQYITSVNTPDYPTADWIINPDLSAVVGQPRKYWKINGNSVQLMNTPEQAAADAAIALAIEDEEVNALDNSTLRRFALIMMDEINILRNEHSLAPRTIAQLKNAMRNK